jgi:hypothetical protein
MTRLPFEEMASSHRLDLEFAESDRISIGGVRNQFPFVNTALSSSPKKMKSSRSKPSIQVKYALRIGASLTEPVATSDPRHLFWPSAND